jgi:Tfp pilus assembly major pilin PilA
MSATSTAPVPPVIDNTLKGGKVLEIAVNGFVVTSANFKLPAYKGGFDRNRFWDAFVDEHTYDKEEELIKLLLDMARCHWSPKVANWPGMTITLTAGTKVMNFDLQGGKSGIKPFHRGKGKVYTWTSACLATGAIFEQVFRKTAGVQCDTINGNHMGCTQFLSLVEGFTEAHYNSCCTAMDGWIGTITTKKRDANATAKIQAAAKKGIADRSLANSAFSLINAVRYGFTKMDNFVDTEQITFTEAMP